MRRSLLLILCCMLFSACSKDFYFKRDQHHISKALNQIAATDQAVRKFKNAINTKYSIRTPNTVWDSLHITGADRKATDVSKLPSINTQLKKLRPEAIRFLKLIIKEQKAGRLTDGKMRYFIGNINARQNLSHLDNLDIEA